MLEVKNKSIGFVINSLEGGGAERVICNLLRTMEDSFAQQQCKIYLILLDNLPEQQACPEYVTKVTLSSNGKIISSYQQLNQWVNDNQPDLLVSFLNRSNLVCSHIGNRRGIPTVISVRGNTTQHFSTSRFGFASKFLIRMLYPKASCVVPVSKGVMQDLVDNYAVKQHKCKVMYNAYDALALNKEADSDVSDLPKNPYIIGIGRLVKNKNFALLVSAFAASQSKRDLVILGQGPELQSLQGLASELNVSDRVHFPGFKPNPYAFLKNADYLVSSSNGEGFPNGIAEAMFLGKAVISTNCKYGPGEILAGDYQFHTENFEQAEYGVLCQTNNRQAMTASIDYLEKDDNIVHYQARSLQRSKTFSFDKMHSTFCEIIETCLN